VVGGVVAWFGLSWGLAWSLDWAALVSWLPRCGVCCLAWFPVWFSGSVLRLRNFFENFFRNGLTVFCDDASVLVLGVLCALVSFGVFALGERTASWQEVRCEMSKSNDCPLDNESDLPHCCALRCWACSRTVEIETAGPPQFAFEVAGWAKSVGWIGVIDHQYSRSLVFCSQACLDLCKTKRGTLRLRPPLNISITVTSPVHGGL
jgi:hypothetical protein